MQFKKILVLYFVSIFMSNYALSQQTHIKKDSTKLYEHIESFSTRSWVARILYPLLFNPAKTKPKINYKTINLLQKTYSAFEGKIIRNINIETLDPFKNSIAD